jgi:hypothetical protein
VLLDGRLGDDELVGDLPGSGRGDERVLRQRGPAQGRQHLRLSARQCRRVGMAEFGLRGGNLVDAGAGDPAAGVAERDDVAIGEQPASDRSSVHPGAVGRQAEVADIQVRAPAYQLGVQAGDGAIL